MPAVASATAANVQILNEVVVNFNDSGGNAQPSVASSVTVTVLLVPTTPTLAYLSSNPSTAVNACPAGGVDQGTSVTLTYSLLSTSNGPATYTVTETEGSVSGWTTDFTPAVEGTYSISGGGAYTINLGASTLTDPWTPAVGSNTIYIPDDQAWSGFNTGTGCNGIVVGDQLMFGGSGGYGPVTVSAVGTKVGNAYSTSGIGTGVGSESRTTHDNTCQLTVTATTTGSQIPSGTQIGQIVDFTLNLTGTHDLVTGSGAGQYGTETWTPSVSTPASPPFSAPAPAVTSPAYQSVCANKPSLSVTKAALVTTPAVPGACAPTDAPSGGINPAGYSTSGLSASPGQCITYVIWAQNTAAAGGASDESLSFTDVLPPYVKYVASSGRTSRNYATGTYQTAHAEADTASATNGYSAVASGTQPWITTISLAPVSSYYSDGGPMSFYPDGGPAGNNSSLAPGQYQVLYYMVQVN